MSGTIATPLPTSSPDSPGFSPDRLNRLDGATQAEIAAGHYAGISVMVARHGKLVKSRCYGYQALGGSEPLREYAILPHRLDDQTDHRRRHAASL
jgi:CubicO group peptidase (beta-lactamase class C family)